MTSGRMVNASSFEGDTERFTGSNPVGSSKSKLTCGVIGNTSDFGSEESKFEPWQVNFVTFPNYFRIYYYE